MGAGKVQVLSHFQIIALKNLYDNDIWPEKIGIIHKTGDLIVEYKESCIGGGGIFTQMRVINIPHIEPDLI